MTKPLSLFAAIADFCESRGIAFSDPGLKEAFGQHVRDGLDEVLGDPILLHGKRTEAMFEALVTALGAVRLIKSEDGGRVFPADRFRVPDYRIVLENGEQWLVEVKNVYRENPRLQRSNRLLRRPYRTALEAYAEATGAKLKIAIYWARWSIWTLVSPEQFTDANGDMTIDMMDAIRANELALLGDRTIGTKAPLRLRLDMDPAKTTPTDADGNTLVTIGGARMMTDALTIEDDLEKEIASILMEYGDWNCDGPLPQVDGDRLRSIDFVWTPEEPTGQGFDMIATLSRMFSRYYAARTLEGGVIHRIRAPLRPGWFTPLATGEMPQRALRLWRFELKPVPPLRDAA